MIPVWDDYVAAFAAGALVSLTRQESPMQLIVVDNASAVALPQLGECTEVVRSDRRLSLGAARNLGLTRVQTPYVLFWDADDTMLPRTLPFLEAGIEADQRLAAFGGQSSKRPADATAGRGRGSRG